MFARHNLLLRILSGVCLGAIAIWGVVWSNFILNLLLASGAVLAGLEWTQIVAPATRMARSFRTIVRESGLLVLPVSLLVLWAVGTKLHGWNLVYLLMAMSLVMILISLTNYGSLTSLKNMSSPRRRGPIPPLASEAESVGTMGPRPAPRTTGFGSEANIIALGFPIIGATILSLLALHQGENWHALIFLLSAVSATDIGAFAVGKAIGGPKLAPRISPNKTWAGGIGGIACAMIVGAVLSHTVGGTSQIHSALVASGISVLAQVGDLLESALKRRIAIKDSGFLIPGHGGILDRIDGLLLAAPVFTIYRLWLGGSL